MNITQRRPPRSIGDDDVEAHGAPITSSPWASIDREAPLASPSKRKRPPPRSAAGGIDCAVHTLRKFAIAVFRDLDDDALKREDVSRIDVLATLLKEVAISCLIAVAILTALLFVGRYFRMHIAIAHKYERALVNLLYDESVTQSFDEDGLRLMPVEECTNLIQEINNAAGKIKMEEEVLEARTRALEEARKERAEVEVEYPKLFSQLNLDHFCADCKWSGGQTCLVRAAYLEEKYQTPKFRAMISAMEKESCRKSAQQLEKDKQNRGLEEKLLADRAWETDFCSDCEYDRSTTCHVRASFLGHWYGLVGERARARVMAEAINCRLSHHQAN